MLSKCSLIYIYIYIYIFEPKPIKLVGFTVAVLAYSKEVI